MQREKNKEILIKPPVESKSKKSKEGKSMADPDKMAKKFFQDIQNTQKQTVDSLAKTREALQILTEKLQGVASINEKGSTSEEPRNLKSTPSKSTKTIFLPADEPPVPNPAINPMEEVTGNLITLRATYNGLDDDFRSSVPFREYVDMMNTLMPKKEYRREHDISGRELKNKISKFIAPTFDGTNKISARAWLQKLQTFTLNPMKESDVVQIASLHLEDAAYDWWYHGMTTQGHDQVTTFDDFSQRVIDRFDLKDDDYEDVVVHDGEIPGVDEQTLSIHDFFEREYQAQLDASSHEVEASSTSHDLSRQLKVCEDSIVTTLSHHDRYVELVGIGHITQVKIFLELPANSSLRIWTRDCYIGIWDSVGWRSLTLFGSSVCLGAIMDLISRLHGVVFSCASILSDVGISFYTPMLGFVHISSRPYLLECVDDISYLAVCIHESQDHIGIDDIQKDAMGNFEDLVSLGIKVFIISTYSLKGTELRKSSSKPL